MPTCGTSFWCRSPSAPYAARPADSVRLSPAGCRKDAPHADTYRSIPPCVLLLFVIVCVALACASTDSVALAAPGWAGDLPWAAVCGLFGRDGISLFGRFRRSGQDGEESGHGSDGRQIAEDSDDPAGDAPLPMPPADAVSSPPDRSAPGAAGEDLAEDALQILERIESIPSIVERYSCLSELDDSEFRDQLRESGITLPDDADETVIFDETGVDLPDRAAFAVEEPGAEPPAGMEEAVPEGRIPGADAVPVIDIAEDTIPLPDQPEWPDGFDVFPGSYEDHALPDPGADDAGMADEPEEGPPAYAAMSIDDLVARLGSDDAGVRQQAAAALGARGTAAVQPLIDALGSQSDQIRWSAADALRLIGDEAIPALIGSLNDVHLQLGAATALVKVGEAAVPHLIDALADEDGDIRIGAAYALEEIGAPAIPFLVENLMRPEDEVRRDVAGILSDLGWTPGSDRDRVHLLVAGERWVDVAEIGGPAVDPLLDLLASADPSLRRSAARTLGAMGPIAVGRLIAVLGGEDGETRRLAGLALADIGSPAVKPLIDLLKNPNVRDEAASALVRIGEPAVLPLIAVQQDGGDDRVEIAQSILVRIGDGAMPPLIHTLLTGRTAEMRAAAEVLEAMGWEPWDDDERVCHLIARGQWEEAAGMGSPAAAPLVRVLADDDPGIRREAAAALGRLADPQAVLPLVRVLDDAAACTEAAEALVRIGEPAVAPLLPVLEQNDGAARRLAAEVLGRIGSAAAAGPLVRLLYVDDDRLRRKAGDALSAIGEPAVALLIPLLAEDDDLQPDAVRALAGIGTAAVESLLGALASDGARTRAGAAEALDRIGWSPPNAAAGARYLVAREQWSDAAALGEPALGPLITAFCGGDAAVRDGAAEALVRMGRVAVPALRALLRDERHRDAAADLLVRVGDAAIDPLATLLGDDREGQVAAEILVRIGDAAVPALLPLLTDPERGPGAAEALAAIGPAAVEPLIGVLGDGQDALRRRAGDVLLAIGSDSFQPLIAALDDPEEEIRLGAVAVLTRAGAGATEALTLALQDGNFRVRLGAAEVLGRLGWQPEGEAEAIRYLLAKEQWAELAQIGAPAVESLIAALSDPDPDVQMGAAMALGMIGKPAVAPLILTLREETTAESEKAIAALKKIGDPAIHALIQAFRDDDWHIRIGAARALVRIGSPAVDALVQALHAGSPAVKMGAAAALGKIGDARALEPLVVVLLQEDWHVGRIAVHALGMLGPVAVGSLTRVLAKGNETAWKGAVEALVLIGVPAEQQVAALLVHENYRVRAGAAETLDRLGWRPAGEDDRAHYLIAKEQWVDLAHLGAAVVEPLLRVLGDDDDSIRRRAAGVLGETRDSRAAEPLARLLCDEYHSIRREAATALVKIGEPSVAPLIASLADVDEDVRRRAAGALGEIGGEAAARALTGCLDDPSWHVQKAVRDALEAIRRRDPGY